MNGAAFSSSVSWLLTHRCGRPQVSYLIDAKAFKSGTPAGTFTLL